MEGITVNVVTLVMVFFMVFGVLVGAKYLIRPLLSKIERQYFIGYVITAVDDNGNRRNIFGRLTCRYKDIRSENDIAELERTIVVNSPHTNTQECCILSFNRLS